MGKQKHRKDKALFCITYQTRADPCSLNLLAKSSNALITPVLLSLAAGCPPIQHIYFLYFTVSLCKMYQRCLLLTFFRRFLFAFLQGTCRFTVNLQNSIFSPWFPSRQRRKQCRQEPKPLLFVVLGVLFKAHAKQKWNRNSWLYQKK